MRHSIASAPRSARPCDRYTLVMKRGLRTRHVITRVPRSARPAAAWRERETRETSSPHERETTARARTTPPNDARTAPKTAPTARRGISRRTPRGPSSTGRVAGRGPSPGIDGSNEVLGRARPQHQQPNQPLLPPKDSRRALHRPQRDRAPSLRARARAGSRSLAPRACAHAPADRGGTVRRRPSS